MIMILLFLPPAILFTQLAVQAVVDGVKGQPYTLKALLAGVALGVLATLLYYF